MKEFSVGMTDSFLSGHPHLEFRDAMYKEHCTKLGAEIEFTTSNYGITTCARKEWQYAVEKVEVPAHQRVHGRRIPDLDILMKKDTVQRANLQIIEAIAVILYTGPMVSDASFLYNPCLAHTNFLAVYAIQLCSPSFS